MALENQIAELTVAINALITALKSGTTTEPEEEEAPPKRGRGRPPKQEAAPPTRGRRAKPEPEEEEEEEEPAPKRGRKAAPARGKASKGPSAAEVRDTLREVSTSLGTAAAKGLLTEFDCKVFSDLEESDYPEFMKACQEALEAGADEDEDDADDDL